MFFGNENFTPRLLSAHFLSWDSLDTEIPPKTTYAISIRVEGDCVFETAVGELRAVSGDVFYFPKGVGYKIKAGRERLYSILFETDFDMPDEVLHIPVRNIPFFETAFMELYRAWSSKEIGFYARATSYFYRIIAELARESENISVGYQRLRPAVSYVYSHYRERDLTVERLADEVGVSDTYLRRLFKSELGESPNDFINKVRIDSAAEYLEMGFYTIERVAELCGFADAKYFSTVFKKYRGMPPSEYMRSHS